MEDGEEYGGYVKNNAWNYYHLVPASGSQGSIFVTLQQQEEEGEEGGQSDSGVMDCNLYIQSDSLPSKTTYSYRDLSTESVVQIPILNPMGHTWYIGVYGFHYCNYVISQSVLSRSFFDSISLNFYNNNNDNNNNTNNDKWVKNVQQGVKNTGFAQMVFANVTMVTPALPAPLVCFYCF